jgi:cell fate regulator YaaT (PSP1 superfamily)
MYNKDKEISRVNALNARSATKTIRNSIILDDLESVSVADFLRQLSLDDEGRRKTEDEDLKKRNTEVLDVIGKAIDATKARVEERRRKEEEQERLRLAKIEEERRRVFSIIDGLIGAGTDEGTGTGTNETRTIIGCGTSSESS